MSTILCIDEEEQVRNIIVDELGELGHEVLSTNDGLNGLKLIHENKPDLVICEITMPGMGGFELMNEIRKKYTLLAMMPFIFLSAFSDEKHILAGLKMGADHYLTKPVDNELLKATVEASLRQMARIKYNESVSVLDV